MGLSVFAGGVDLVDRVVCNVRVQIEVSGLEFDRIFANKPLQAGVVVPRPILTYNVVARVLRFGQTVIELTDNCFGPAINKDPYCTVEHVEARGQVFRTCGPPSSFGS